MTEKEKILAKLKALAERGVGGEAENAQKALERLMKKYNIDEIDFENEKRIKREFRYSGTFGEKLLQQIIYMVMGDVDVYHYTGKSTKVRVVECTEAEAIEIEAVYNFYKEILEKGLKNYYSAFVQKEMLFPDKTKKHLNIPEKEYDPEVGLLYNAIEHHSRFVALLPEVK